MLFAFALISATLHASGHVPRIQSDSSCSRDFEFLAAKVQADYAGFREKVTNSARASFDAFTSEKRVAAAAADSLTCTGVLRSWVAYFKDPHLSVAGPPNGPAAPPRDNRPALSPLDDSTLVLRLPSFGARWKAPIDLLLSADDARLTSAPYLIIDVRGNNGGGSSSFENVLPLLFTDSLPSNEFETYASPGNTDALRQLLANAPFPADIKAEMSRLLRAMEGAPGEFVRLKPIERRGYSQVLPRPARVAILIDERCVSACELFLIDARVSRKVMIVGHRNSGGMVDFGNLIPASLPSGVRRVNVPIARSLRPRDQRFDVVGITPDLVLPTDRDLLTAARAALSAPPPRR